MQFLDMSVVNFPSGNLNFIVRAKWNFFRIYSSHARAHEVVAC